MKRFAFLILCSLLASGARSQTAQNPLQEHAISLGTVQNGRLNLPLQTLVQNLDSHSQTRIFHLDWTYLWGARQISSHATYDRVTKNLTFEQHGQMGDSVLHEHFVVTPMSRKNLQVAARWPDSNARSLVADAYFGSLQSAFGAKRRDIVPTPSEILRDFPPSAVNGLNLEIFLNSAATPPAKKPLALRFRLINTSQENQNVDVSGSCGTVHAARFIVISPDNTLSQNNNGSLAGGPHCFCSQNQAMLAPGASVELQNVSENPALVTTFYPRSAGKYIVVGIYALPDGKRLITHPLKIQIADTTRAEGRTKLSS